MGWGSTNNKGKAGGVGGLFLVYLKFKNRNIYRDVKNNKLQRNRDLTIEFEFLGSDLLW